MATGDDMGGGATLPMDWKQAMDAFEAKRGGSGSIFAPILRETFLGMKKQELQVFSQQISPIRARDVSGDGVMKWAKIGATKAWGGGGGGGGGGRKAGRAVGRLSRQLLRRLGQPGAGAPAADRASAGPRSASSGPGSPGCRPGWSWPSGGTRWWCSRAPEVGWGASGRNGGQIVNGLNAGLATIERRYGEAAADFVGDRGAGGRPDHPRAGVAYGSTAT